MPLDKNIKLHNLFLLIYHSILSFHLYFQLQNLWTPYIIVNKKLNKLEWKPSYLIGDKVIILLVNLIRKTKEMKEKAKKKEI
jgi:branched-subunit amino acid transport protein